MKRLKYLLFLLLILPFNVYAFNFNVNDEIKDATENINESAIRIGNEVELKNNVKGINTVLGNNVKINSESEYIIALGNNLNVSGNIKNDGIILGNLINLKDFKLNRDLVILGNEVEISGDITGKLVVLANKIILNGNFNNVSIKSNNIIINGNIKEKLEYNEDAKIDIKENSNIKETIKTEKLNKTVEFKDRIMHFIYNFGGDLFIFLAICLIVPNVLKKIEEKNKDITILDCFSLFGFGALSLIVVPIIFILLISLIFGISLAFLLIILYFLAIWLSGIFTSYLVGNIIWNKFIKKQKNPLLIGLLGISVVKILSIIPFIGSLVATASIMIGMGIILQQIKRD